MFRHYKHTAVVSRLDYAGTNKATKKPTGNSYVGFLKVNNNDLSDVGRGAIGKTFNFQTDINADIQQSDLLTIDGKDYTVKAVTLHEGFRIKFLRAIVVLSPGLS